MVLTRAQRTKPKTIVDFVQLLTNSLSADFEDGWKEIEPLVEQLPVEAPQVKTVEAVTTEPATPKRRTRGKAKEDSTTDVSTTDVSTPEKSVRPTRTKRPSAVVLAAMKDAEALPAKRPSALRNRSTPKVPKVEKIAESTPEKAKSPTSPAQPVEKTPEPDELPPSPVEAAKSPISFEPAELTIPNEPVELPTPIEQANLPSPVETAKLPSPIPPAESAVRKRSTSTVSKPTAPKRPSTTSTPGPIAKRPSAGAQTPVPTPRPVAKRQSSGGGGVFDIFDTILNKQDELLKERNKSEQEKSTERTKLELERRRKKGDNPYALTPFAKQPGNVKLTRTSSTDSMSQVSPTPSGSNSVHPFDVNPRDPLGLMPDSTVTSTPPSSTPTTSTSQQPQTLPFVPPVAVVPPIVVAPSTSTTPHIHSVEVVPPVIVTPAPVLDYLIDEIPLPSAPLNNAPSTSEQAAETTANDQLRDEETDDDEDDEDNAGPSIDMMELYNQSQSILTRPPVQLVSPVVPLDMIPIPASPPPASLAAAASKPAPQIVNEEPEVEQTPKEEERVETEPTNEAATVEDEEIEEYEPEDEMAVVEDVDEEDETDVEENELAIDENANSAANSSGADLAQSIPTSIAGIPLDPSTLLRIGDEVLEAYHRKADLSVSNAGEITYGQVLEDPEPNSSIPDTNSENGDVTVNETTTEPKPLPEFYGEPVPEDDDNDDALFEMAAGLPPRKRRDAETEAAENEEPPPDDSQIELDYFNADMNIKADAKDKWMIDPDNGDGFALMWGCVKATFGILLQKTEKICEKSADPDQEPIPADPVASTRSLTGGLLTVGPSTPGRKSPSLLPELTTTPKTPSAPLPAIVYQVRIVDFLSLKHVPFEEIDPYDLRVGWSAAHVQAPVGEAENSYAFCRMGRRAHGNIFTDYGQTVSIGDIVTVLLDIEANEIRYFVNDTDLGVAFTPLNFQHPHSTDDLVIHPHIGLKNIKVAVNFGNSEDADEVRPTEGTAKTNEWRLPTSILNRPPESFKFFGQLDRQSGLLKPTARPPAAKSDCTVLMMVGLPGAGKTHWVRKYLHDHSRERWIPLNTDIILNLMKVNGIPRKRVHQGRWDMIMGLAAKALARALTLACRRRHNYIIDQSNVSRESRRRKLTLFKDFLRRCVVIVPTAEDFEHRQLRQARAEPANQIPPEAMLELKGMMSLPEVGVEPLEDVHFVEPNQSNIGDAIELVRRYNEEGKPYLQNKRRHKRPEPVLSDSRGQPNQWGA